LKLDVGQVVDRYTVERVLGAGGTAVVYLVKHNRLGTRHALKVLTISSTAIRERMLREGRVQAKLQHLNVVAVSDVLEIDGAPALLMEYIDGPSLEAALQRYRLTMGDAELLFTGILSGVRAAHAENLVHRDLKPANVLLARTPEGFVPKVTDFGLAKVLAQDPAVAHTRSGISMGTPSYMAPEQIRDARTVDQRADIWSLGCILYELMTRRRAFPGDEALAIYNAVVDGEFEPPRRLAPDLPARVEQAIHGCLMLDRDQRIPDCATLQEVLRGDRPWALGLTSVERTAPPLPRGPSITSNVPPITLAQRGPDGATPGPPPERGSRPIPAPASAAGLESAVPPTLPSQLSPPPANAFDSEPETVVQRQVDGTLAPSDSLHGQDDEGGYGWLAWLVVVGFLIGGGMVGMLLIATLLGGLVLRDGPAVSEPPEPAPVQVVAPSTPEVPPVPAPEPVPSRPAPSKPDPAPVVVAPAPAPVEAPAPAPEPAPVEAPAAAQAVEVRLLSNPFAASIWLKDQDVGRTPRKLELPPGRYPVRMTSGDQEGWFVIEVEAGGTNTWCYKFATKQHYVGTCP
jgi:serine/threonine protein kinase